MTLATSAQMLALGLAAASSPAHAGAAHESEGHEYRDPFEEAVAGSRAHLEHRPPASLAELAEYLAPVLKYYALLLGLFALARYLSRAVDAEDRLKDKEERKRPNLRHNLVESEDEDEDESESEEAEEAAQDAEDDVHEELITDGAKLVKLSASELTERRKKKSHPLFEGLQKIEEELKQKQAGGGEDAAGGVSWNELHQSMLKRYQQKFPAHGLRVQTGDDYDDEFKELLKKHKIDPAAIRRDASKDE